MNPRIFGIYIITLGLLGLLGGFLYKQSADENSSINKNFYKEENERAREARFKYWSNGGYGDRTPIEQAAENRAERGETGKTLIMIAGAAVALGFGIVVSSGNSNKQHSKQ